MFVSFEQKRNDLRVLLKLYSWQLLFIITSFITTVKIDRMLFETLAKFYCIA